MFGTFSNSILKNIYGTLENLEEFCDKSKECWKGISTLKCGNHQKPYKPYLGEKFNGLIFAGINLNGGNDTLSAIENLVLKAINQYLINGKYKIFKQQGYGGSPFYYYIPLLSFLYYSYSNFDVKFTKEGELTKEQIISGFKYCGLTNLIKCSTNSPDGRSKPSKTMYVNCINKFKNELDVINPNVLVIFTFFNYPSLLVNYFDDFSVISKKERYRLQRKWNINHIQTQYMSWLNCKKQHNNHMHSGTKKRCSFLALLFGAGGVRR